MKLIIVDVNAAHKVFAKPPRKQWKDLQESLTRGKPFDVVAVHGGELTREYQGKELWQTCIELNRTGRMRLFKDSLVDGETQAVRNLGICKSNDTHVIALARVSHCRLLCSQDRSLQQDFKNQRLINPRGSVYGGNSHNHLLR